MADSTEPTASTPQTKDIVFHHLADSRSQRILWLLEELGVPYELKRYDRGPDLLAPEEYKKLHPVGAAPILTDGDVTLAESGTIVEYLINKYGSPQFLPQDDSSQDPFSQAYLDNLYFTHYAEGTLMPLLVNKLLFTILPARVPFLLRPVAKLLFAGICKAFLDPRIENNAKFINSHLLTSPSSNSPWFAHLSHPTAADFMMSFPLEAIGSRTTPGVELGEGIERFIKAVHERPAYKRALEKGGKYKYAG